MYPETPISFKIMIGTLIRFKVYSLIEGYQGICLDFIIGTLIRFKVYYIPQLRKDPFFVDAFPLNH